MKGHFRLGTNGIDSEWFSRTRLSSVAGTHIPEEGVEGAPVEGVVSEVRRHGACPAAVGAAPHVSEIPGATDSRTCNSSRRSSRTVCWVSKTAKRSTPRRGNQPAQRSSSGPPRPTYLPAGHHLHIASLDPESPTFDHRSKNRYEGTKYLSTHVRKGLKRTKHSPIIDRRGMRQRHTTLGQSR